MPISKLSEKYPNWAKFFKSLCSTEQPELSEKNVVRSPFLKLNLAFLNESFWDWANEFCTVRSIKLSQNIWFLSILTLKSKKIHTAHYNHIIRTRAGEKSCDVGFAYTYILYVRVDFDSGVCIPGLGCVVNTLAKPPFTVFCSRPFSQLRAMNPKNLCSIFRIFAQKFFSPKQRV